jgi:hypothetical protein
MPRNHFDKRKREDERREPHAPKIEVRLARKARAQEGKAGTDRTAGA